MFSTLMYLYASDSKVGMRVYMYGWATQYKSNMLYMGLYICNSKR
jgi:hypothetical protein